MAAIVAFETYGVVFISASTACEKKIPLQLQILNCEREGGRDCVVVGSASESDKGAAGGRIYTIQDNEITEALRGIVLSTINLLIIFIPAENSWTRDVCIYNDR